jgi:hypothetical protein
MTKRGNSGASLSSPRRTWAGGAFGSGFGILSGCFLKNTLDKGLFRIEAVTGNFSRLLSQNFSFGKASYISEKSALPGPLGYGIFG